LRACADYVQQCGCAEDAVCEKTNGWKYGYGIDGVLAELSARSFKETGMVELMYLNSMHIFSFSEITIMRDNVYDLSISIN
jgi:hypothetical protein